MTDIARRFLCVDCGVDTSGRNGIGEYYVVRHKVWAKSGLGPRGGMLCIGCLETRIGRRLVPLDFPPVWVNEHLQHSQRLRDRMGQ